jgi:hypothetical protein
MKFSDKTLKFNFNHSLKAINSLITQSAYVYLDLLPQLRSFFTSLGLALVLNPALWVIDGQNCFVITGGIEHSVGQFDSLITQSAYVYLDLLPQLTEIYAGNQYFIIQ